MRATGAGRGRQWTEDEPGWRDMLGDLRRLYYRSRARPLPLLLICLCTTAFGLYRGYLHRPVYEARIALRLTENDVGGAVAPRPVSALRAWVTDVALSDKNLIAVLDRFHLYTRQRVRGLDQALESLREDIEVEVWRNEFLNNDADDEIGRSARVALSYKSQDPDEAFGVVEALAQATVAEQKRMRRAQVEYLAMGLEPSILAAREQLLGLKLGARGRADAPMTPALGAAQRQAIEDLEKRIRELQERRDAAALRLRAETLDLGLRSEIIDTLRPQRRPYRTQAMATYGGLGLLVGLLFGGLVLKAFDRRIYNEEDLRRLGYVVCGCVPAYPGDDVGSMRSRVRMMTR